ncbi:Uncharacterized protein conserved in bacteria [Prochlorococcus marinus str. MIT 9515]|uniref:Uncharacterized protein conserved in bacteria n=1 Tax=Prochlorococcus marinus (strain MIT 9515) TaxID=167542 RepID=A2BYV0_PROM5|nr:fructosamine kinase family protein [Prochlorococcus marinus]ABM72961.1 Uncharacterized protein conserved in bacteria [Prochlorococcus marinus str. MIT 9515]
MQKLSHFEVSEICNQLGEGSPKSIKQVFGGDIHKSWEIEFQNAKFFLKRNERKAKFLKFEEFCLKNLQKYINYENLIIPKIVSYIEINNVELLLMEWIDMSNSDQQKLGQGLAEMHIESNKFNPQSFGCPVDGYIGTKNQTKGWRENWIKCFIDLRIEPQLAILDKDFLEINIKNKIKSKIESELHYHEPFNALVHGDLWSGNVGVNQTSKGVIFDPASWWADCEVDIAMTKLFGNFRSEFYENYYKIIPIKKGFEKRTIVYNFYHVLNHANMFGGSYCHQVKDYIKKILSF